jgi:hypothetical protein
MNAPPCPRCSKPGAPVLLQRGVGVVGEDACGRCGGRFLAPEVAERVVVDELGFEREMLHEVANLFSGLRIPCPGCTGAMRPLRLRSVAVDLCFGCGSLWLDRGELRALSGGRHDEVGIVEGVVDVAAAAAPAVVVGRDDGGAVKLGRGRAVVLFDSLDAVAESALKAAFARTDGLTNADAAMLARYHTGVVVEGVSDAGAAGLVRALVREGVGATVAVDDVLRLPPALASQSITVDDNGVVFRFHTGPPFVARWSEIVAVVAGVVRGERVEQRPLGAGAQWLSSLTSPMVRDGGSLVSEPVAHRNVEVRTEDLIAEILHLGETPRRLRVVPSPRPHEAEQVAGLAAVAATKTAVGRGPAAAAGGAWPSYRRTKELERELAWVGWRAARWPRSA